MDNREGTGSGYVKENGASNSIIISLLARIPLYQRENMLFGIFLSHRFGPVDGSGNSNLGIEKIITFCLFIYK